MLSAQLSSLGKSEPVQNAVLNWMRVIDMCYTSCILAFVSYYTSVESIRDLTAPDNLLRVAVLLNLPGDLGHQHNFAMSCVIQNVFNAYVHTNWLSSTSFNFSEHCL